MEKSQLAGNGLAALVLMGSLGNTMIKPMPQDSTEITKKLDQLIAQSNNIQQTVELNKYRIGQLEKIQ